MIAGPSERAAPAQIRPSSEVERQYGVLPWRRDRNGAPQVLLITSRTRGRWIVPKGWLAKDRAPYLSAALEAFEEAGVIGEVTPRALGSYRYVAEEADGARRNRLVTLFGLRVVGTLTNWPERGQRKRRWFGLAEAAAIADDTELARMIRTIHDDPQILTRKEGVVSGADGPLEAVAMS